VSDGLAAVLRLVADGRLTAQEAVPLIDALDERGEPGDSAAIPPASPSMPSGDPARHVRVEVTEHGRSVVNLRVPLALGQAAVSYVPGLDAVQSARVKEALARGLAGPILEIADADGDGVRIVLE
jgi:hypothetical protein